MRFLIMTNDGIGDILHALSMAKAIKNTIQNSIIDLIMPIWTKGPKTTQYKINLNNQILECQSYVNHLYWYSKDTKIHDLLLLFQLRGNKYEYGIGRIRYKTAPLWEKRILRLVGCKAIVSPCYKADVSVHFSDDLHYLKRISYLLSSIGIKTQADTNVIDIEKVDIKWVGSLKLPQTKHLLAFSMGTDIVCFAENGKNLGSYNVKAWGYKNWINLALKLTEKGYYVALIGGQKEEREMLEENVSVPYHKNIFNFIAKTNIKQTLALLSRCKLVVGSEGGVLHCAAAVGTKTLTLFGGTDYRLLNPGGEDSEIVNLFLDCAPCYNTRRAFDCKEHRCLTGITVDMVYERILSILEKQKEGGHDNITE